jgi:hypothetical protein
MTRLDRKKLFEKRDINIKTSLFGLMDSVMIEVFRITESELDKICELATDDELELFTKEERTISESRRVLEFLKKKIYVS